MSDVTFTSWGGANSIGPSCHVLNFGGYRVGIDYGAGLRPHDSEPAFEGELDALLLTHGHRDHVGMVPRAIARWPKMLCWATKETRELALWIWEDGMKIETREQRAHLFSADDIQRAFSRTQKMIPGTPLHLTKELTVTPFSAGHILGAVGLIFTYRGEQYVATGDIGLNDHGFISRAAVPEFERTRLLITESTYAGIYAKKSRQQIRHEFLKAVWSVMDDGGRVLIPTLAIDRMQEMYQILHEAGVDKKWDLWVVGGAAPTEIYRRYAPDSKLLATMQRFRDMPHQFRVQKSEKPVIVLASSGMLVEDTPSYAWATTLLHEPGSAIFMVNWQDPCEFGGRILASGQGCLVEAADGYIAKRCRVERFDFSTHAKQDELDEIVRRLNPDRIIHVHGENERIDEFLSTAPDASRRIKAHVGVEIPV
ncbi:MAG: MBL fold metallo-hydrolase [Candidatus Pacebacteria bacterium]|nr:MBL fold metallo-hydrolase [Candidatus Paceibacterota bacterium]